MATLQASTLVFSFSSSSSSLPCSSKRSINATTQRPNLRTRIVSIPKLPTNKIETAARNIPSQNDEKTTLIMDDLPPSSSSSSSSLATDDIATTTAKLYAILEAVSNRVEMHENVGEQRDNWNSLLLNSINMITLTASAMAGLGNGPSLFAFKLSSTLLFSAATGMLIVMNKIQPSQLTEEQRNASRLFKRIRREIETLLALRAYPNQTHVNDFMEKVLALDKAYPLPMLGVMLEKFPSAFEPAVWWPPKIFQKGRKVRSGDGWNEEIDEEMREVAEVIKRTDIADYVRLGNLALKIHKVLAISGPILTAVAAVSSALGSTGVATTAGALAAVVNTLEHGGQVGMVVEMYRNCAGFFNLLQESIESTLEERGIEEIENGELFEMKVGLELGRSVSQLRDLASKSASSRIDGINTIDEFASKLF